jgi:FlaG/FlaF family flagellin (archaellin)
MMKKQNSGVSPVISVILMITLAIILAATVSQFTFELEKLLKSPVQAGLNFDETYDGDDGTYDVQIVWSSEGNVESLYAIQPDGSRTPSIDSVGQQITINSVDEGEEIRVIGRLSSGQTGVVRGYTVAQ